MDLSPEEEEAVERLSYALVTKIVLGPVFGVMARARLQVFYGGRTADCAVTPREVRPETSRIESEQVI